jgi:photosystem II stability/assembly factor-like uncharacterized protein
MTITKMVAVVCAIIAPGISCLMAQSNSWEQTGFPQQYSTTIWGMHVLANGTVFAGTLDGLLRSTDNGETWKSVLQTGATQFIASTSHNTVFCNAGDGGGLFRSTDNGDSWVLIGPNGLNGSIHGLAISANDDIFIGDVWSSGIYRSSDSGNSWTQLTTGFTGSYSPIQIVVSHTTPQETLFLTAQDLSSYLTTLYRSTDNGNTWSAMTSASSITNLFVHSNGYLFFKGPSGLMRSTNNGTLWQVVWAYDYNSQGMISLPSGDIWAGYNLDFWVWGTPIFRSTDNGKTWASFDTVGVGSIYIFVKCLDGSILMATEPTGLFKTANGGTTWHQVNSGFPNPTARISAISGNKDGLMLAGTVKAGSFVSTNAGANWTRNYPGHYTSISRIIFHPSGLIFAGGSYLQYSADSGNHWPVDASGIMSSDLALDRNGNIYSAGYGSGVQFSSNAGATWTPLPCPGDHFDKIHVTNQGVIVALTSTLNPRGNIVTYYTRRSTDKGLTWFTVSPGGDRNIVYDYTSTHSGALFAATGSGIYCSLDSGTTWNSSNIGLPSFDARVFAVDSLDILYAGTNDHGVYRSTNQGNNWEPFNKGLTDSVITSLYSDPNGYLFAGTYNRGIFKTVQKTTTIAHTPNPFPAASALFQNFPNPFNPSTTVSYSIRHSSLVNLRVFDVLGREVAVLVNMKQEPGLHRIEWKADGVPSGIYYYRLSSEGQSTTRTMVLIR